MDTRRDAGEFYPGGKVISTRPVATGGDVKHSDFADLDVKTNTLPDLRSAVKERAARLGATVVTALAVCAAIGAEVQTAKFNELDLDADPSYVANVTFEGLATTNDLERTVAPIARQVASNETAIASHASQLSQLSQSLDGKYDLYLSGKGSDSNDGLTASTPKRTLEGCYAAATNDAVVCVFPGTYVPVSNERTDGHSYSLFYPANNLTFIAVGGKDCTVIEGEYTSDTLNTNGYHHTLGFYSGPQKFKGFTIRRLSGWGWDENGYRTNGNTPCMSSVELEDCDVVDCDVHYWLTFGAFNECRFTSTTFAGMELFSRSGRNDNTTSVFVDTYFDDCKVFVDTLFLTNGNRTTRLFDSCAGRRCLFVLPPVIDHEGNRRGYTRFEDSTFVYDYDPAINMARVNFSECTNCYFCVGGEDYAAGLVSTNGNAFAKSWTNTCLSAEYVPALVECPAVRDDGRPDAGWRDSGLSRQKMNQSLSRDISTLRGDFVSASNSFSFAMAEAKDYVDLQFQNVYQQAIGYTDARLAELDVYGTAARAASNTVDDILLPRPLEWMYATGDGSTETETAFAAPSFAVSPIHFTSDAEIGEEFAGSWAFLYPAGKLRNYSVLIESIPEDIPPSKRLIIMDFDELCASNKVYATPKLYAVNNFEHAWRITTNDVPCVITLREPEAGTVILRYDKLDGDDPGAYLKMEDGAPVIYQARRQD